jgi:hypothetical protein
MVIILGVNMLSVVAPNKFGYKNDSVKNAPAYYT